MDYDGGHAYGDDDDTEGGVNDDLVGAAFGAKERSKHGDFSAFEHPLERRANELKQNGCKVSTFTSTIVCFRVDTF